MTPARERVIGIMEHRGRYTVPASDVGYGAAAKRIISEMGNDKRLDLRWDGRHKKWILYYHPSVSKPYIVGVWGPSSEIASIIIGELKRRQRSRRELQAMAEQMEKTRTRDRQNKEEALTREGAKALESHHLGRVTTSARSVTHGSMVID